MKRVQRQVLRDGALFVFALASGMSVLLTRSWKPADSQMEESGLVFPSLSRMQPHGLNLNRDGQTAHITNQSMSPDSPVWYVDSPWKRRGDAATIDTVVTAMRDLQVVRKLESGSKISPGTLKSYALDRPQCSWQIELDGAAWTLKVGVSAPPPRGGTYVEVVGPSPKLHQLYVVSGDIPNLTLRPEQLLEARLFPHVPSDVRELGIDSVGTHSRFRFDMTLARWYESDGQHRRISRERIDKLLFDLTNLKAEHFIEPAISIRQKWGKEFAVLSLSLNEAHPKIQIELFQNCEG